MALDPTLVSGGLKLLGGLFGSKKPPTPSQNIRSQAKGARMAAEEYGFNPLTMLQYGQPGGSMASGGPAPLASLSILGDFIQDNYSDEAKDRREHNQLATDLLRVQLDQARSAVYVPPPPSAVEGAPLTGGRTAQIGNVRRDPTVFGVRLGPLGDIIPDEGYSDAERIEERYGDAVSWAYGAAVAAADLGSTFGQHLATEDWSPLQKPRFKPDGYTEDGKPFWKIHNGITFNKPVARDGGKDY